MTLRSFKRAWWHTLLIWIGAAFLLWWVFQDVDLQTLGKDITHIKWGWVILAVVCDVLYYSSQGFRWNLLLWPFARITWLRATQAIYGGLLFNQVLPFRMGELVRSYLVVQWTRVGLPKVVATVLVERMLDGFWLAGAFIVLAISMNLPRSVERAGNIFVGAVLAGFILIIVSIPFGIKLLKRGHSRIREFFSSFYRALQCIENPGLFFVSLLASAPILLFKIMAFWFVMIAYGFHESIFVATAVVIIERIGTFIPNAPANLGAYQFFVTLGLMLFGVEKTQATGISMLGFLVFTLPSFILGPVSLAMSGINTGELMGYVRGSRGKSKPEF